MRSFRPRKSSKKKPAATARIAEIQFGREICGDLDAAEAREWLVTNGIGGFASGTIAGSATRRYHGLLIAAFQPPLGRTHLVAGLDETVRYAGGTFSLATHRWASGAVEPRGFLHLESFCLEETVPVWSYALADALLEKRVWMRQGENTTFVQYTLVRASSAMEMDLKALVNYRGFHSTTHAGEWRMQIARVENGVKVLAFEGATPFYLKCAQASCEVQHEWYRDFYLARETERGLDAREDYLFAALFTARLSAGENITLVLTTEPDVLLDAEASRAALVAHEAALLQAFRTKNKKSFQDAPPWLQRLVLAADQFIVKRCLPDEAESRSVIAGYHWFSDWGRDAMIALPGLTLATGRPDIARQILLSFARYVDAGLLPNNFADASGQPEYNTVDATLWFFEAARQYEAATKDLATLERLFPVLEEIVKAHLRGTRYNIHVDPIDALLYAGGPSVQLTWMDAKVGDWIVTPRTGKPVEVNALWINALETIATLARSLAKPANVYEELAAKARKSFQKFWDAEHHRCFDVIDAPGIGNDAAFRPNQIFAVSLPVSPLTLDQQKSVVDACAQHLLTSYGLRSLAPGESAYQGRYGGDQRARNAAYHQGTVWGWLLGPFVLAHYRVYKDRAAALRFLEPLGNHITTYGLGTLGEIFDGDPPHAPRGCIAQAWTVGEILRAWTEIANPWKNYSKD